MYYTNNTPYTIDIPFCNDLVTDTEHYSDAYGVSGRMTGATEAIPLYALSEIGSQDHTWTLNWVIEELYIEGIPMEEYYE